jgi:DNA-binding transcriptional LysR family regulator
MEWSDVRIFLALARAGSLGGAARALGLSHPTIGRRLSALEESTGQKLFQRTAEGFVLTQEGASVLALAEQIEEAALTMTRRLAGQEGTLEGTLRVAASDWFGAWMMPEVVDRFAALHPRVCVELLTGPRVYSLSHREADLAFRVVPFEETEIVQRRLLSVRFAVYASAGATISLDDGGAGVHLIEDALTEMNPVAGWLKQRLPDADVVLRSNNRTVQAQMCAEGVGIAVLPRAIGDRHAGLRRIAFHEEPPPREVWMGYHTDLRTQRRLRAFVDVALECLSSNAGSAG